MITKEIKIVFLGEQSTGKTSLIKRYIDNTFQDDLNSTYVPYEESKMINCIKYNTMIKMNIWDTAGQTKFRNFNILFYRDAHIIVLVYSITDRNSYKAIQNYWLYQIKEQCRNNPCI